MDRFVARQNIKHYQRLLAETHDAEERARLERLLAEAHEELRRAEEAHRPDREE